MIGSGKCTALVAALAMGMGLALSAPAFARDKDLDLSSPDIQPGSVIAMEQVFNGFGCTGKNISPALNWTKIPGKAKSLALMVYDPDAPTGSGFWHWVVFNIPTNVHSLPKNAGDPKSGLMPAGAIQSTTDFGTKGWGGPCPPAGDKPHHYIFTLFAVDVPKLDADENTTAAIIGFQLHFHTVETDALKATFGR